MSEKVIANPNEPTTVADICYLERCEECGEWGRRWKRLKTSEEINVFLKLIDDDKCKYRFKYMIFKFV